MPPIRRALFMFFFVIILPACTCWTLDDVNIFIRNACEIDRNYCGMEITPSPTPEVDCSIHRLTSPRDGLPNGVTTFYWDPVPNASNFTVNIISGNSVLARWNADGSATNMTQDVSFNALGGENPFTVSLVMQHKNGRVCIDTVKLDREAPPRQAPLLPTATATPPPPPPTPDCEADPYNVNC